MTTPVAAPSAESVMAAVEAYRAAQRTLRVLAGRLDDAIEAMADAEDATGECARTRSLARISRHLIALTLEDV